MCVCEGSGGLVYCEEGVCVGGRRSISSRGGGVLVLRYATACMSIKSLLLDLGRADIGRIK